jgi:uncharacterized membrane protein
MDPTLKAVLAIAVRWIHITSVVALIGGFMYARFVVAPALAALGSSERAGFVKRSVDSFRPILYTLLVAVLGSGLYNYLTKASYPARYHMFMGIKLLFVLHIFAVSILYTLPSADEAKRQRWLSGMIGSGLVIFAIAGYLRWISMP